MNLSKKTEQKVPALLDRRVNISLYLILRALNLPQYQSKFELKGNPEYLPEWNTYIKLLEMYALQKPNIYFFKNLIDKVNSPYTITIHDYYIEIVDSLSSIK